MARELYIIAILASKPENADEVRALLLPAVKVFRAQDGCRLYALHEDEKRPGRFITYETWRDHESLYAHNESSTWKEFLAKAADMLDGDPQQNYLTPPLQF